MNPTPIIDQLYFARRRRAMSRYEYHAEELQLSVLRYLIKAAANTEWGRNHGYKDLRQYSDFTTHVGINTYEELKGYILRMRKGESNVLWRGKVNWFAKSSGTTNDKSKFIPVSREGLKNIHYLGGTDCVAAYLGNNPKSRLFAGKSLILGGSHAPNLNTPNSLVGDLSAILIENVPSLVNLTRIPPKEIALLSDFEEKRERIARFAFDKNVTNISGVPSWMLSVLKHMLDITGRDRIDQLWPNLEVFFHGGVAFTPYREQYKNIITLPGMHYMETYNASEGFFGVQTDLTDPAMMLMIDYGVFYEFIPMSEFGTENPKTIPLWQVKTGVNYAVVISTSCGLWRYVIGDTIRFTHTNPYKFVITGRTKHFINAFGEELIVDNAEHGLEQACIATGAQVREYTAAPVFMGSNAQCRHQWVIEFAKRPASVADFATILDRSLQAINSDYEAKRYKDITLQPLQIVEAREGLFDEWLKCKGKLGGQHKIPRLSNSREYIDELLMMNRQ
ncbi:MAG: GH3 auxin-responsive promoter family protein [Bacteroidaceae bacterium]|nr:GH3 auxin-responsive promoter family protein [Bacteroidaceae bacterium]MBQ8115017.1 GH3 auxin-responsive promoter family protein [Prevotella sp.]MBQ8675940.1 GH3 auxin-responsive promoter family protein [Bacteroidaceae bacterium]MBR1379225.1 GH3 auxin-responsive promoter family protein [Bacteroidaceae bacterium]